MRIVTRKTAGSNKSQSYLVLTAKEYKSLKKTAEIGDYVSPLSPEEKESREKEESMEIEGPALSGDQELKKTEEIPSDFFGEPEGRTKADKYMDMLVDLQEAMKEGTPPISPKLQDVCRKVLRIPPEEEIPVERLQEVSSYLIGKFRKSKKAL